MPPEKFFLSGTSCWMRLSGCRQPEVPEYTTADSVPGRIIRWASTVGRFSYPGRLAFVCEPLTGWPVTEIREFGFTR